MEAWAEVAIKTAAQSSLPQEGYRKKRSPKGEREVPLLSESEVFFACALWACHRKPGWKPQDIEWACDRRTGEIAIFRQEISAWLRGIGEVRAWRAGRSCSMPGVCISGRRLGRAKLVHSLQDLEEWRKDPCLPSIMILRRKYSACVQVASGVEGVVVDLGNPATTSPA